MVGSTFTVLMVCSGNICRSPIAEQLLRARTRGRPITVSSAGVIARAGAAMTDEAAMASRSLGGDPTGHRARRLSEDHLRGTDLVLTATRAHRSSVVQLLPRMSRTTFTISEFARLVAAVAQNESSSLDNAASLVDAARSLRGHVPPPHEPEDDDIEDPYLRPLEVYERVAAVLNSEIEVIATQLIKSRSIPR